MGCEPPLRLCLYTRAYNASKPNYLPESQVMTKLKADERCMLLSLTVHVYYGDDATGDA